MRQSGRSPMKRLIISSAALVLTAATGLVATATPASAAECANTVETSKGWMTAAVVNESVTADQIVDATGCAIGVYYDADGTDSSVDGATVENATHYGVFVDGGEGDVAVDVTDSKITNIGDQEGFTGGQHGLGVYYYGFETEGTVTGTVSGNTVWKYQKGGITANGAQADVDVTGNTVTGLGPVDFIAQNGVQLGWGAVGSVTSNTISGNSYTGCSNQDEAKTGCTAWVSTGLLLYDVDPASVHKAKNKYRDNQRNLYMSPSKDA